MSACNFSKELVLKNISKNNEFLINSILNKKKIIQVEHWSVRRFPKHDVLYTATDGLGNYTLCNDDSVFFTTKEFAENLEIHGKPHSTSKGLFLFKIKNEFGVYDNNFKRILGPFDTYREFIDYLEEMEDYDDEVKKTDFEF